MPAKTYHHIFEEDWDPLKANIQFVASYKEKWLELIPLFEQISEQNAVFIMIWNVVTNRIIYTVDKRNVLGYKASLFLADNGVDFLMSNVHPEFADCPMKMQEKGIEYILKETGGEKNRLIINLEVVSKKATGEYSHFLQQTVCIETDSKGNPYLFLSYVHDVRYMKKHRTANLVITTPIELNWWNFNFDKNCLEPVQPLSKQEKKILACLAEGKSSKVIANELFISSLTVDTHRRNLLNKTNCVDTTGMITYARLVGLI